MLEDPALHAVIGNAHRLIFLPYHLAFRDRKDALPL